MSSLPELPEWVKSLGLPKVAADAIDRFWKPVWDDIRHELELLPEQPPAAGDDELVFEAVEELEPGPRWQASFEAMWPAYQSWYLKEGEDARPGLAECRRILDRHMPELVPTYERLVELAGGDDLAARFLSLYRPPGFVVGCTQGAWTRDSTPVLVRNYDYPAARAEGIVYSTAWTGRRVIGMSDCLWGLLDGVNDAGLAASLTFGGRREVGEGFGIPVVIRYLLETCETVAEAEEALTRIPVHAAQNVTLLDRNGAVATACVGPGRDPEIGPVPAATNHQREDDWPDYARAVRSFERERYVLDLLDAPRMTRDEFVDAFLKPPLYSTAFSSGFGTIYTAAYHPAEGRADYLWPGFTMSQTFDDFVPTDHTPGFTEGRSAA
jgi:predicted choloylglycine hydrolase